MTGIVSYGAYIPIYRMGRDLIARQWGVSPQTGERSVANYDEDSITMAVEAVIDCLGPLDRHEVDGLYFASTTPPYHEKQSASIVAAACDLRRDIFTADFTGSLRSATSALRAAQNAIEAGAARRVVVVASDCRQAAPASDMEPLLGDGAAAFLLGDSEVVTEVEGSYSLNSESLDIWRKAGDRFPQGWEDRFVFELYAEQVRAAVSGLLDRLKLAPKDFTQTAWYGHDRRGQATAARALGFDPRAQIVDTLFDTAGNTGAALAPMMLVEALEKAKAGDRVLMVSYGDGCDTLALRVGAEKQGRWHPRGVKGHLGSKLLLASYGKYLRFRDLCEWAPERRPSDRSAATALHRDRSQIYPLKGQRCRRCGGIQYAIISRGRVCTWCQARDDFEEIRLSDKRGTLFTFSMDQRAMEVELPNVLCVVDLEGGGRFYGQMTDREPEKLEVGMPVELTFRRIHGGSGLHNYFWKVRPIRVP